MQLDGWQLNSSVHSILIDLRNDLLEKGIILLKDIKPTNKNIMITCIDPLQNGTHKNGSQESNPSCGIHMDTGIVNCFTCGYTASFPEFISKCFGKHDAGITGYKWLAKRYIAMEPGSRDINLKNNVTEVANNSDPIDLWQYRQVHPYMYQRGLTDEIINQFEIGFDTGEQSVVFPVKNFDGNPVFLVSRSVWKKFYKFPAGSTKGNYLYGLYELWKYYEQGNDIQSVVVCEGIFDCLTAWKYGKPAVALMGAHCSKKQLKHLNELPGRELIIALDNDVAGEQAARDLRNKLKGKKLIYRMKFPAYAKDLNDVREEDIKYVKMELY